MEKESVKKIAIIFPGMGYHKDKPLLYYSGRIPLLWRNEKKRNRFINR